MMYALIATSPCQDRRATAPHAVWPPLACPPPALSPPRTALIAAGHGAHLLGPPNFGHHPTKSQKEESGKPNLAMAAPPVTGAAPHNAPTARVCSPASRSHGRAHVDHPMLGPTDLLSGSLSDSPR
ncbi:vegetative cell wall protein gp1-like [Iris pallida]|uniref:Vegetative cell wall protein gp1-like n=1 Tax=Iris pallida TaxID=29817 RepID=A0AAX6I5Y5_IRIPA|nr:vegetative cell wall protein gp1-like [Iris pallida]